jgi:hypothetical protein
MQYPLYFQNFKQQTPVTAYLVPGAGVTHLVIHAANHQPWHSYSAPIQEMAALLQNLLAQAQAISAGQNPLAEVDEGQAVITTPPGPLGRTPGARMNPGATDWDWLTPEMVIAYVEQSPMLHPVAADVRAALGKTWPAAGKAISPRVPSQLELDLSTIRPYLDKITAGGKINKSEIARGLGLPTGGSGWSRVQAVAGALSSSSSTSTDAPPSLISAEKIQSEAA